MRTARPMPCNQVFFMAVLLLLAYAGIVLWFYDPGHRAAGPSRVAWPATSQSGP